MLDGQWVYWLKSQHRSKDCQVRLESPPVLPLLLPSPFLECPPTPPRTAASLMSSGLETCWRAGLPLGCPRLLSPRHRPSTINNGLPPAFEALYGAILCLETRGSERTSREHRAEVRHRTLHGSRCPDTARMFIADKEQGKKNGQLSGPRSAYTSQAINQKHSNNLRQ